MFYICIISSSRHVSSYTCVIPYKPEKERKLKCLERSTNKQRAFCGETVRGNLEIERGGTLPDTARDIVMRTMTGTEPATEVAGFADRDTAEMSADA